MSGTIDGDGDRAVAAWEIARSRSMVFTTPTCDGCVCGRPRSSTAIADLLSAGAVWLRRLPDVLPLSVSIDASPATSTATVVITVESLGE